MADGMGAIIKGAKSTAADITLMQARVDVATAVALKKVQQTAKTSIRRGMRGQPRWDRRGKIGAKGVAVNLHRTPHHIPRAGGPGKLTGRLVGAVGGVRKPKKIPGGMKGGVGVGGKRSLTQLYRAEVEARYPYMAPGVKKAEPKFPAIWSAAWAKATNK